MACPELLAELLALVQVADQGVRQKRLRSLHRWPTRAGRGTATCARSGLSSTAVCCVDFSSWVFLHSNEIAKQIAWFSASCRSRRPQSPWRYHLRPRIAATERKSKGPCRDKTTNRSRALNLFTDRNLSKNLEKKSRFLAARSDCKDYTMVVDRDCLVCSLSRC